MISKVLPLFRITSGCDYHRIILPLGSAGYDFSKLEGLSASDMHNYKVLLFNRTPLELPIKDIENLKNEKGFKVVVDIDDYWILEPTHYLHRHWKQNKTTEKIIEGLKLADAVTCTTERLAAKIRQYNSNVHVIPNALPFNTDDQFAFRGTHSTKTRFGFVGGPSHTHDLRLIAPVFQHFNHLDFTLAGFASGHRESVRMRDICNQGNPNFKVIPVKSLGLYMYGYDGLDCCIAPLVDIEFNKYKSNLKVIEAGSKKCAVICSPVACYTDTVPDTVVTYCKSTKDWKEAIKKHQDLDYAKERGKKLYDWVKTNYNLGIINQQRIKLLCDIQPEILRQEDLFLHSVG